MRLPCEAPLHRREKELTSGKIEFVGYELDGLEVLNDD